MQWRNVAFIGSLSALAGWLLASTVTPPVARVQSRPPERAGVGPSAPELPAMPQIHLAVPSHPPLSESRRNPFVFATRTRAAEAPRADEGRDRAAVTDTETVAPVTPAAPAITLSGIGMSGDLRTAVLTTGGDAIQIVKVDDVVAGYRVVEITSTSVTLTRDQEQLVLRFPQ